MLVFPQWQTVPFHWIWITITFLYGFRRWTNGQTAGVLGAVIVVTTIAMLRAVGDTAELSEIPLMTCVFLGMVWHVRRRQDAVDAQRRVGDRERQFMRDAAHTLRTPLTIARGHAEFVLDDLEPGTQGRQDATVLLDELRRLTRISDQLLLLATAEREEALLLAPVELDRLVADVGRRFAHSTGRAVTVHAAEPITVLADEERLRHALDALVENALHATEAGGEVAIDARVRDGRAVLEVSDTGVGIGDSDRGRIFERFARGANAEHRPGTGLGLPIVKAIAEAHGGGVSVASRPGAGTSFTLRLGAPQAATARAAGVAEPLRPVADGMI
ncbi:MAG: two-component system, OmpR family, sensor kinase [Solirubrobacteraceae bacterium]|jgi:signal transduction histidine kinase|nr:two-component system, OmpR family, sensor kinase [Solirubrobacteraceae bacterium]